MPKHPKPLPSGEEHVGNGETRALPPSQTQWHWPAALPGSQGPQGAQTMGRLESQAPKSDDAPWSTSVGDSPEPALPARALVLLGAERRWRSEHGHPLGTSLGADGHWVTVSWVFGNAVLAGSGDRPHHGPHLGPSPCWDLPSQGEKEKLPMHSPISPTSSCFPFLAAPRINPSHPLHPAPCPGLTPSSGSQLELGYVKTRKK